MNQTDTHTGERINFLLFEPNLHQFLTPVYSSSLFSGKRCVAIPHSPSGSTSLPRRDLATVIGWALQSEVSFRIASMRHEGRGRKEKKTE